jgi:hypothetical protein
MNSSGSSSNTAWARFLFSSMNMKSSEKRKAKCCFHSTLTWEPDRGRILTNGLRQADVYLVLVIGVCTIERLGVLLTCFVCTKILLFSYNILFGHSYMLYLKLSPEVEFKDNCSSTAWSVIESCLVKAGYKPCLRTGFFQEIFLFQRHSVSITAQSVID